jgi:hypothetical protein
MFSDLFSAYPELKNETFFSQTIKEYNDLVKVVSFVENQGRLSFNVNSPIDSHFPGSLYCLISNSLSLEEVAYKENQRIFRSSSEGKVPQKPKKEIEPVSSLIMDLHTSTSKEDTKSTLKSGIIHDKSSAKNVEGEIIRKKEQRSILSFFNSGKK